MEASEVVVGRDRITEMNQTSAGIVHLALG